LRGAPCERRSRYQRACKCRAYTATPALGWRSERACRRYNDLGPVGSAAVKTVYRTTNPANARIVTDVLAQHGLAASVLDEYTGAYGDPLGSVRVVVAPERERDARAVIAEWEAQRVPETEAPAAPAPGGWSPSTVVLVAAVIAVLLMVWYFGSFAAD
jgi:hypothetical protein